MFVTELLQCIQTYKILIMLKSVAREQTFLQYLTNEINHQKILTVFAKKIVRLNCGSVYLLESYKHDDTTRMIHINNIRLMFTFKTT